MARLASLLVLPSTLLTLVSTAGTTSAPAAPFPTSNATSTCPVDACQVQFPKGIQLVWSAFTPTSTIVAATVRVIVKNGTNATTTTTIFNELPAGVELPPTNDAGTRIATMTSFAATGGVVTLAYPTVWADYDSLVSWSGILSTKSTCTTVSIATITLPPHPPIPPSKLLGPSETGVETDSEDPRGIFYSPFIETWPAPIGTYASQLDESALISCQRTIAAPPTALQGVRFLTETETSFDTAGGDGAVSTSKTEQTSSPGNAPASSKAEPTNTPPEQPHSTAAPVQGPSSKASDTPPAQPQSTASPVQEASTGSANSPPSSPQSSGQPAQQPSSNPNQSLNPKPNPNPNSPTAQPQPPSTPPSPTPAPVLTLPSATITATSSSVFVIGTQTLTPGGTITIPGGTTLELNPTAPIVVVNGESSTLSTVMVTPPPSAPTNQPVLTIGDTPITAAPGGGSTFVIGSQTLTPGGTITVSGTTLELNPTAPIVVVNGETSTLANPAPAPTSAPPLTINGQTFTALPGSGTTYVVNDQTLTPGGVVTIDGTTVSLPAVATAYGSASATGGAGGSGVVIINNATSTFVQPTGTGAFPGEFTGAAVDKERSKTWVNGVICVIAAMALV